MNQTWACVSPTRPLSTSITAVLLSLAVLGLVGCSPPSATPSTPSGTLNKVLEAREVHIGYLPFDPCVIKDPKTGKLGGTYVDAIEEITRQVKAKPIYHETTVATFAAGLESGQFDVSIGPAYITIARAATASFSQPLNYLGNGAVVRKGDAGKYDSLEKIAVCRPKVAVQQGQAMDEFFSRRYPDVPLLRFGGSGLINQLAAVSSGQADIGFMNILTVRRYAAEHPEVEVVFDGASQLELLPLAWAVRPGDLTWLEFLDDSLEYLVSTGRWAEIQARYPARLLDVRPE